MKNYPVPLKTEENIEAAIKYFNDPIQRIGWLEHNA
jgi:hypothetical protein